MNGPSGGAERLMKIIAGGQSGADRAGLDVARHLKFPWGGYAPRSWLTEDGTLSVKYRWETVATVGGDGLILPTGDLDGQHTYANYYRERTKLNVELADLVLIFVRDAVHQTPGSRMTRDHCQETGTEWVFVVFDGHDVPGAIRAVLEARLPETLMIAGSRESKVPGIYAYTYVALREALK